MLTWSYVSLRCANVRRLTSIKSLSTLIPFLPTSYPSEWRWTGRGDFWEVDLGMSMAWDDGIFYVAHSYVHVWLSYWAVQGMTSRKMPTDE